MNGASLRFTFCGKSGIEHDIAVTDLTNNAEAAARMSRERQKE